MKSAALGAAPFEPAVLIVPPQAARSRCRKKTFVLRVQEIVPLFPMCKGNPIKFYGAYWASPSICFRL